MDITCKGILEGLAAHRYDERLSRLYCCDDGAALTAHRERVASAVTRYQSLFSAANDAPAAVFSGPGRTEIGGNHTDHQHGRVLAASVNMDMLAVAAPNETNVIYAQSEGYPAIQVDLTCLTPQAGETNTSAALIRGVAAQMAAEGHPIHGFNAYITSGVPAGSGLSSSAAYEVLIGVILNHLFCGGAYDAVRIAQIGQISENRFFGKPCGLMDQMASAVGGAVSIDFRDPRNPVVHKVDYDFTSSGYALCIIDSGADHADLTEEYAAITVEMTALAAAFGKGVLRDVDEAAFRGRIPELRKRLGDRAVLRGIHFFHDNRRAKEESEALEKGDFSAFLALVRASGLSSALHLQNTWAICNPKQQAIPLALAVAEELLQGRGASRVHGGGFAGTLQAFVPNDLLPPFKSGMEALLGKGMCHVLSIRPEGGCVLIG